MRDRYAEALDFQMDLARRLTSDAITQSYVNQIIESSMMGSLPVEHIGEQLEQSHTYFVTDEMVDLITWAASSMPDHPLEPNHLPTPYGFAWLEKAVSHPDSRGEPLSFRGLSWGQVQSRDREGGILLCLYGDTEEMSDRERELMASRDGFARVRRLIGRVHLAHITPWRYGEDWVTTIQHADIERALKEDPKRSYDLMMQAITTTNGWCTALWAVMNQELGAPEVTSPPRATRKRAQRGGKKETDINVVHLRRNMGGSKEETDAERADGKRKVKVRYWVKPFWRRQWYPKQQVHRLILIPPHERGPKDAPLKTKQSVWVVDQ